eukprot:6271691-Pyramimonas_sp.AAC.1
MDPALRIKDVHGRLLHHDFQNPKLHFDVWGRPPVFAVTNDIVLVRAWVQDDVARERHETLLQCGVEETDAHGGGVIAAADNHGTLCPHA